jgi:hypothetical protein
MTALVMANEAESIDQAAVEYNRAAFWALEYVGWVLEFGYGPHADHLFHLMVDANRWAIWYELKEWGANHVLFQD